MNASTSTELSAVAGTQSAVDAMAVVTLSPEKYAAEVYQPFKSRLVDAIDSVKAIDYDIKTTSGMAVAIKARATFRDLRIEADKERKARKEPITKIGKLLESGFDQVEERITPLEALFDTDIQVELERKEAEKAAKIAAERAHTEAIQARIQAIRDLPMAAIGRNSTAIESLIAQLDAAAIDDTFEDMRDIAAAAWLVALESLNGALATAKASEAAALAVEEARKAEAARIEAERQELAKLRAEAERVANEQAATAKRLADQEAAQALAAKQLADKAAANLRAEREAQELAMRLEREKIAAEQAKAAAKIREAQDKLDAALSAQAKAIKLEAEHAQALIDNAQFDADCTADLARCTATAKAMLSTGRSLVLPESYCERDAMIDAGLDEAPTDGEILDAYVENFGGTREQAIERLAQFDSVAARSELMEAA